MVYFNKNILKIESISKYYNIKINIFLDINDFIE